MAKNSQNIETFKLSKFQRHFFWNEKKRQFSFM